MEVKRETIEHFAIFLVVFVSVVSQNFVLRQTIPLELICDGVWIFAFIILLLRGKGKFETSPFLYTYIAFIFIRFLVIVVLKNYFINNNGSMSISTFLPPPLLVYIVSYMYFRRASDDSSLDYILSALQIGGLVLAATLYLGLEIDWSSWFSSKVYAINNGKNAIGHILAILLIVNLFYKSEGKSLKVGSLLWSKPIRLIASFLYLTIILYVQCRTALLAMAIIVFIAGLVIVKDVRIKIGIILAIVIAILAFVFNDSLNSLISHALFLDKYDDINSFSSGRININARAMLQIQDNLLLGSPNTEYVDNFYINTLLNTGIIIGALQFILMALRMVLNVRYSKSFVMDSSLVVVIASTTLYEFITSLVEAYPPFGPGVAVMVFWVLSAYCDACMIRERGARHEFTT